MRHLIQVGHRRIAIITGALSLQTGRERLRGYEEALREADIGVRHELISKEISVKNLAIVWARNSRAGA